jgi:hypothetical protein
MTLQDDFPADDLDTAVVSEKRGPDAKTERFPCQACGGTGKYRGVRTHQTRSDCFACSGKGYFLTSERDRQKARAQKAASKARRLAEARAAFDEQYPDVAPFLAQNTWSPFVVELASKLTEYGSLTDGQVRAVRSMAAKVAVRTAERAAERHAGDAVVDLSPIRTMFEAARANGYKRPVYRAAGLIITRASDIGKNPGALYVKSENDDYLGKIIGTAYTGKLAPALSDIAADPRGEAVRYGQRTGTCSCCGRTLTVGKSIEAGIGPICAEKWGL